MPSEMSESERKNKKHMTEKGREEKKKKQEKEKDGLKFNQKKKRLHCLDAASLTRLNAWAI